MTKKADCGGAIIDLSAYRKVRKPAEPSQEIRDETFCGVLTKQGKPTKRPSLMAEFTDHAQFTAVIAGGARTTSSLLVGGR